MNFANSLRSLTAIALAVASRAALADSVPADLDLTYFAGPDKVPCPACICVSAEGDVYAGVDLNGSLGKGPGRGRIVKLVDRNRDGLADDHTVFAAIDNARGIQAVGNKVFVLHTAYDGSGVSTGMNLDVLEDANRDGVADGPAKTLVRGICSAKSINDRGTDHACNGIRMGIDGWIYIAVGDFGFHNATGTDGRQLTLLGGGIARVRPDGTELEMYTTGTRNIYDVAIDPLMDAFTRGNTNDGGGWNVRFLHHIMSAEFGYPRLFKNFATEILPALEDVGGGSGVGALFLSEPTWPARYNNQPLMGDWGRKAVFLHRLTTDGPSFTQKVEEFVQVSQVTDLDVDPSGQMYVSAWDGAGYKGDESKGYIVRITPKGWKPTELPSYSSLSTADLLRLLASGSATARLYAQQELLVRTAEAQKNKPALIGHIKNASLPLEVRVAALFTLAQIEADPGVLLAFSNDDTLCEFALRAAADRLPRLEKTRLPIEPFMTTLANGTPRQRAAAAIALGRTGDPKAAPALLKVAFTKPAEEGEPTSTEGFTIKPGRKADVTLNVTPGNELRVHVAATDNPREIAAVALKGAVFTLSNGNKASLADLKPTSGNVGPIEKDSDAKQPAKSKKAKRADTGESLVITGPSPAIFTVPADAVNFSATAEAVGIKSEVPSAEFFVSTGKRGEVVHAASAPRHATPNSEIIVPHLAAHALVRLRAVDTCLSAVGTDSEDLALWALSYQHDEKAVDGLLSKLKGSITSAQRLKLLTTLARLYQQEAPYDGSWWWTTRPDTHGPYYKPVKWAASPRIASTLEAEVEGASPEHLDFLARLNDSHRLGLKKLGTRVREIALAKASSVDLSKIASQEGAMASTAIEDVMLALDKLKPNHARGEELFTQQGCIACHALAPGGPALGPFMGQIGSIMNAAQIATAILRPSDTISQGFQSVQLTMNDGSIREGFISESTSEKIVLRDVTGAVSTVLLADVKEEKHLTTSMMPEGLANSLSIDDFAALVHFLASKK